VLKTISNIIESILIPRFKIYSDSRTKTGELYFNQIVSHYSHYLIVQNFRKVTGGLCVSSIIIEIIWPRCKRFSEVN